MPQASYQLQKQAAELAAAEAKPAKKGRLARWYRQFGQIDMPLLTIVLLLLVFGLVMLFSASYPAGYLRFDDSYAFIRPQLRYALLGIVCMLGAAVFPYQYLKKFAWPLMGVTLAMLVVVLLMDEKNGARRWIWLNGAQTASIQPSEFAKFAVIVLLAALMAAQPQLMKTFRYGFIRFAVILGIVALLLIQEPHLSCTILVLGIGVAMMFAGGTKISSFVGGGLLGGAGIFLMYTLFPNILPHYADDRVAIWLDPLNTEGSHQVVQSLIAVGSGGVTGVGIGNSVQKFLYLPEMYNDYIYAIICEELGLIGGVLVMLLFALLLARGLYIAVRAKDMFGSLLVVGISVQIALQAFLHVAVNINAIPSTGISMPFFSSGGSSLVMLLGQIGVMLSVSRKADLRSRKQMGAQDAEAGETGEVA